VINLRDKREKIYGDAGVRAELLFGRFEEIAAIRW